MKWVRTTWSKLCLCVQASVLLQCRAAVNDLERVTGSPADVGHWKGGIPGPTQTVPPSMAIRQVSWCTALHAKHQKCSAWSSWTCFSPSSSNGLLQFFSDVLWGFFISEKKQLDYRVKAHSMPEPCDNLVVHVRDAWKSSWIWIKEQGQPPLLLLPYDIRMDMYRNIAWVTLEMRCDQVVRSPVLAWQPKLSWTST